MSRVMPKTCYVLMPFSKTASHTEEEWTDIFESFLKPTFESQGFSCSRSNASVGMILKDIVQSVYTSEIIVADLTDGNPNVFYELGLSHTMTNRVMMITQNIASVPSDLKPYGVILYDATTQKGAVKFAKDISEAVRKLDAIPPKAASPIFEFTRKTFRYLDQFMTLYHAAMHPVALMECSMCHINYEVPLNGMTHGAQIATEGPHLCGHWEPAIFHGIKGLPVSIPVGFRWPQ